MKIAIACDHGGLDLKKAAIKYLNAHDYEVVDFGTNTPDSCDYPDYALPAAESVASGECKYGVLICGTGIGVSMVANKVKGIRCAHCHDTFSAKFTRLHNDANMVAFGQRVIGEGLMLEILETFLTTGFEGGRHQTRIDKITAIENKYCK